MDEEIAKYEEVVADKVDGCYEWIKHKSGANLQW